MKKYLAATGLFLMLMAVPRDVFAQPASTAVPFLMISPNSRASGMGEAGTGVADDAASIHWNPAGLAFQHGGEMSITHSKWLPQFNLSDLFYDYLNVKQEAPEYGGTFGASITYLNLGDFVVTTEKGPEAVDHFSHTSSSLLSAVNERRTTGRTWILIPVPKPEKPVEKEAVMEESQAP